MFMNVDLSSNFYFRFVFNIFTVRCYASAVYAMALCLSVTSRCSTKMAEHRITLTKPHDSSGTLVFLVPKISTKFDQGHSLQGRQMQAGWVKIGDFRQIAGYISKMVQDRHMVSIKVEQQVVFPLSNGDIADDCE